MPHMEVLHVRCGLVLNNIELGLGVYQNEEARPSAALMQV